MSTRIHLPGARIAGGEIPVAVLLLESVVPFDLGVACQVFGYRRPDLDPMAYRLMLCAARPGPVRTAIGFPVIVEHGLEALDTAHTILVPGFYDIDDALPPEVLDALRAAHARGARIASI